MNKRKYIRFFFVLSLFFVAGKMLGQNDEDCSEKLKKAQRVYDDGILETVEGMIRPCLENESFTKPEQVQAYKLLTLIGLFEDDFEMAEENMTNVLKTDPDFKPKASDPFELKDLYAKFRTDPIFTLGMKVGLNAGYATMLEYNSVGSTNNAELNFADISSSVGYQVAITFNYRIDKGFYVHANPKYSAINYKLDETVGQDSAIKINTSETNTMLGMEMGATYNFRYRKPVKIYIEGGIYGGLIQNSAVKLEKSYSDGSLPVQESEVSLTGTTEEEYEFLPNRTKTILSAYYGAGVKYKMGSAHVILGIKHCIGLSNVTQNRINPALYGKYDYILKNITLNDFAVNIGFVQSFYKPKILKRYLNKKNEK